MGVYLEDHRPAVRQFSGRTARPTGLTVIHTAESVLDSVGPDTGAENVAAFIARRTTYGSYHDLVDSDSVIQLVRYENAAYQDGTGSNPFALSISFALRAADWPRLSAEKRDAFLRQGARAFANQQAWLRSKGYPTTPIRRINRVQSSSGMAGFISHGERDPARRTDPGRDFPWDRFLAFCSQALGNPTPTGEDDEMNAEERKMLAEIHGKVVGARFGMEGRPGGEKDDLLGHVLSIRAATNILLEKVGALQWLTAAEGDKAVSNGELLVRLREIHNLTAMIAERDPSVQLDAEAIAAAIPAELARKVADELGKRLNTTT